MTTSDMITVGLFFGGGLWAHYKTMQANLRSMLVERIERIEKDQESSGAWLKEIEGKANTTDAGLKVVENRLNWIEGVCNRRHAARHGEVG